MSVYRHCYLVATERGGRLFVEVGLVPGVGLLLRRAAGWPGDGEDNEDNRNQDTRTGIFYE
jgi:hypothetical protein